MVELVDLSTREPKFTQTSSLANCYMGGGGVSGWRGIEKNGVCVCVRARASAHGEWSLSMLCPIQQEEESCAHRPLRGQHHHIKLDECGICVCVFLCVCGRARTKDSSHQQMK